MGSALLIAFWALAIMGVWIWWLVKKPNPVVLSLVLCGVIAPGVFSLLWADGASISEALHATAWVAVLIGIGVGGWWLRYVWLMDQIAEDDRTKELRHFKPKDLSGP